MSIASGVTSVLTRPVTPPGLWGALHSQPWTDDASRPNTGNSLLPGDILKRPRAAAKMAAVLERFSRWGLVTSHETAEIRKLKRDLMRRRGMDVRSNGPCKAASLAPLQPSSSSLSAYSSSVVGGRRAQTAGGSPHGRLRPLLDSDRPGVVLQSRPRTSALFARGATVLRNSEEQALFVGKVHELIRLASKNHDNSINEKNACGSATSLGDRGNLRSKVVEKTNNAQRSSARRRRHRLKKRQERKPKHCINNAVPDLGGVQQNDSIQSLQHRRKQIKRMLNKVQRANSSDWSDQRTTAMLAELDNGALPMQVQQETVTESKTRVSEDDEDDYSDDENVEDDNGAKKYNDDKYADDAEEGDVTSAADEDAYSDDENDEDDNGAKNYNHDEYAGDAEEGNVTPATTEGSEKDKAISSDNEEDHSNDDQFEEECASEYGADSDEEHLKEDDDYDSHDNFKEEGL